MPIDINSLREDPESVRQAQRKRFKPDELVDKVFALDQQWREQVTAIQRLRTQLGKLQKDVIAPKKKNKEACDEELAAAKRMNDDIERLQEEHKICDQQRDEMICRLGNFVDGAVPVSKDEDNDNEVVCIWPQPQHVQLPCRMADLSYPNPASQPLTHDDLLWRIGGYDPERGTKVAGGRGYFLRDVGVLLNQALINFALAFLRDRGYSPVQVPFFMKKDLMAGIAQLADFDEQLYKVTTGKPGASDDPGDKYLIATSEQPLCAFHYKEDLDARDLPLRYAGVSTCFRKEVGKANVDNRGIFRVHQFEKVEQFCITVGELEESQKMHKEMLQCAEDFHQALGISYRVVNIVSGELNDAAMMKFDLEGWFPGQGQYRELVSCSNCTDFQSRAMKTRYRAHKIDDNNKSTVQFSHVHMLNSTLTATGRGICCILETYQTPDGIRVPDALIPYMGGARFIPFVRGPRELDADGRLVTPKSDVAPPRAVGHGAKKMPKPAAMCCGVDLDILEKKLLEYPYIDGFRASQSDVKTLEALTSAGAELNRHPNVARWMAHVASFTPVQRAMWD